MTARFLVTASLLLTASSVVLAQQVDAPAAARVDEQLNPVRRLAIDRLRAFVVAPLFDPARQLPPESSATSVPAPATPPQGPPPGLQLTGVIHGVQDIAVIRRGDDGKTIMLSTGDHLGPWQVTVLPTIGMQLRNGAQAYEYTLFVTAGSSPVPVATSQTASDVAASNLRTP